MSPKESEQPRRRPLKFPRSRKAKETDAAPTVPLVKSAASGPPTRPAGTFEPQPSKDAPIRTTKASQPSPARPRLKTTAQRKKRRQIQVEESETESEGDQPKRSRPEVRRSGKEPMEDTNTAEGAKKDTLVLDSLALLSMRMSPEKVRLGAAKGEVALKEENATLKQSLEAAETERNLSYESANQEKDQELKTTYLRALRTEQERDASEKQSQALEAKLQASQGKVAFLTEEMQNQAAEVEEKAADWAIKSIYALRPKNPQLDMSDFPEDWYLHAYLKQPKFFGASPAVLLSSFPGEVDLRTRAVNSRRVH
ncbi:variable charge X-linked protein 3B-like [Pistacia vera]|uniref:variable charge X-linked protein 3B-like n=1 Tax=Pistacia vera TaxID=55513 RepID=UPI0012636E8A|nr:variable charge X-linked protein 3B-like [Pistacia vera]